MTFYLQIHGKADDVFVPINARIAKSIGNYPLYTFALIVIIIVCLVTVAKMTVPSPERAKRLSNAKTSVSSSSTKRVTTTSSSKGRCFSLLPEEHGQFG